MAAQMDPKTTLDHALGRAAPRPRARPPYAAQPPTGRAPTRSRRPRSLCFGGAALSGGRGCAPPRRKSAGAGWGHRADAAEERGPRTRGGLCRARGGSAGTSHGAAPPRRRARGVSRQGSATGAEPPAAARAAAPRVFLASMPSARGELFPPGARGGLTRLGARADAPEDARTPCPLAWLASPVLASLPSDGMCALPEPAR